MCKASKVWGVCVWGGFLSCILTTCWGVARDKVFDRWLGINKVKILAL